MPNKCTIGWSNPIYETNNRDTGILSRRWSKVHNLHIGALNATRIDGDRSHRGSFCAFHQLMLLKKAVAGSVDFGGRSKSAFWICGGYKAHLSD